MTTGRRCPTRCRGCGWSHKPRPAATRPSTSPQSAPTPRRSAEVPLDLPASTPGTAALVAERPGRLEIAVDCPARQLLVVAESYHSGWHAVIDGQPREIYRVNGDFMGCLVERGKNRVVLDFHPESLDRGWLASCLGLSFVSLCFLGFSARPKTRTLEDDLP